MNGIERIVAAALAGLMPVVATGAGAQEACTIPAELKGFAHPAAAASGAAVLPGHAVRVTLARDARLPVAPEKAPAAGRYGGVLSLTIATAGRYRVALDGPVWIDLVRDGERLASAEHGHAAPCSGARKLVGYDLTPGRYVVQISGANAQAATVMVVPGAIAG